MFLFQARRFAEEPLLEKLEEKGARISDKAKELLTKFVGQKGRKWKERTSLDFYFGTDSAAGDFFNAMRELKDFIKQNYGVEITLSYEGLTKDGYLVHMEKEQVAPEKRRAKAEAVVPKKKTTRVSGPEKGKKTPITTEATMSDLEKRIQELEAQGYIVEVVDSEEEAKEKIKEFPEGAEIVYEPYTIKTEIDDSAASGNIAIFYSSMAEAKKYDYLSPAQSVPETIHYYGYAISDYGSYNIKENARNLRDNAGDPGGFGAYLYGAYAHFMRTRSKKCAELKNPKDLAAYLCRGYTGVLKGHTEQKTIEMHKRKIQALVNAYHTFDGIRGTIPDDLWVVFRAYSLALADEAISLGIINENRKNEYADAFAFGMVAQIWYESGLDLADFFSWLREEETGEIDPDKVINTIMKERDKYKLFYGDQEITKTTQIVWSPYKDLMITTEDGRPLAHLRISHPKWLNNKYAWEGLPDLDLPFKISSDRWSWLGIGGTAYYHPIHLEIGFFLKKAEKKEEYLIGYKPPPEKKKPKPKPPEEKVVNAFSITGDKEFRIVGTQFQTQGEIHAYGDKSVNDLKQDENFSLDYIGVAVPKERDNVAYIVLPEGEQIKDRLPQGIDKYDKGMQNALLVYEDTHYDLVLNINGKKITLPRSAVPKHLIDEGLKPEHLMYEVNSDGTIDIYVVRDIKTRRLVKAKDVKLVNGKIDRTKYYIEALATGVELGDEEIKAIKEKGISELASFGDKSTIGLDLYAVVKEDKNGVRTLMDAARIAGHEFDYKFLSERGYEKIFITSLPASRVVETATGEKSYHIMPTDIPDQYRDLVVGIIPRELVEVSEDGKTGTFTARLDKHVAVQEGIGKYFVSYYLNYTGKPPVSFEFSNLPVSVETLASKDSKERKAAISQLLSISQNPVSADEASNYIGLISEVEAKWKDRLDKEDRKNLATSRANFEEYSGMAGAGEAAAGPSARLPTILEAPTPPTLKEEEEFPPPESVIPTDLFVGELTDERIKGAFFDLWSALFTDAYMRSEGNSEDERTAAVKEYMKGFMNNLGLPTPGEYAGMADEDKEKIRYKLFGDSEAANDEQTMDFLDALYSGDIETVMDILNNKKYAEQSPMKGAFKGMSNVKIYVPRQMVSTGIGGTVFTFESKGYKGGKLGAPQKGIAFNMGAFVNFMRELYMERSLNINFKNGTITLNEEALKRYGVEPEVRARVEERLAGGEELYAEGAIGLRFIFDNTGRLQTTYGTPKLTVGVGNVRIGNVVVAIEGDYTRLPVYQGTVDRYTLQGKANFMLLVPWQVKAGGRITAGERTAFAVVAGKIVQSEDGSFYVQPYVGAEAKGVGELKQWGGGIEFGTRIGTGRFGIWRTRNNWVFDAGIGVEL